MSQPDTCSGCGLPPHQPDVFCDGVDQPSTPEPVEEPVQAEPRVNGYAPTVEDNDSLTAVFKQLTPDQQQIMQVGAARFFDILVDAERLLEETLVVARDMGAVPLVDAVWQQIHDSLQVFGRAETELRHHVGLESGYCGRPDCPSVAGPWQKRLTFASNVARVCRAERVDSQWLQGSAGVSETAVGYEKAVEDAYKRFDTGPPPTPSGPGEGAETEPNSHTSTPPVEEPGQADVDGYQQGKLWESSLTLVDYDQPVANGFHPLPFKDSGEPWADHDGKTAVGFSQLGADQQHLIRVAVERVHDGEVGLWVALDELNVVARDLGCPWLADLAIGKQSDRAQELVRQVVVVLRHLVGIDGGACLQRNCVNIGHDNGHEFANRVAETFAISQAMYMERKRSGYYSYQEVRLAANEYDRVVMDAGNRCPKCRRIHVSRLECEEDAA